MAGPCIVCPQSVIAKHRIVQFYIVNRTAVLYIEKITVDGGNGADRSSKFTYGFKRFGFTGQGNGPFLFKFYFNDVDVLVRVEQVLVEMVMFPNNARGNILYFPLGICEYKRILL